jgi:hypothetical protein
MKPLHSPVDFANPTCGTSRVEEFPKGRVMNEMKKCQFTCLADACILREKAWSPH